jgi:hypothetical protein
MLAQQMPSVGRPTLRAIKDIWLPTLSPTRRSRRSGYCRRSARRHNGSALITTLICLMVLMMLGEAVMALSSSGLNLAERVRRQTLAFNLAESGAERAARYLKSLGSPPSGTTAFDPFSGVQSLGDGTYSVSIQPDSGNPGAPLKRYTVNSTGVVQSRQQRVELVLRQTSFGKYAYFTDREASPPALGGGAIWFMSHDRIRGPAHSNNADGGNIRINWTNSTGAIFEDMVTTAASGMVYNRSSGYVNPASEADFLKIYKTGSRGYQVGVDAIPLPDSSSEQREAAWGASSGFPTTDGVHIPNSGGVTTGGIYIRGDSAINMQVDGSGNQQFRVTQGGTTTTITIDRAFNKTRVEESSGGITIYEGTGSGVLYSTGNITSLSGTVADNRLSSGTPPTILQRSAYTIATDVNNGKRIEITNRLTYQSAPDPSLPTTDTVNLRPGTLGLMARNVVVDSNAPTNMQIDAIIMAGSNTVSDGSFYVENWDSKPPGGTLKITGGLIQKARGAVGRFSGGEITYGYAKDYWYDRRLADDPPPHFPTTGGYDRISWRKLPG